MRDFCVIGLRRRACNELLVRLNEAARLQVADEVEALSGVDFRHPSVSAELASLATQHPHLDFRATLESKRSTLMIQ